VKKVIYFLFFYFSVNILLAQSDSLNTKLVYNKFTYVNGKIASEGYLKNDKPTGFWKSYYQTGVLKSEGKWKNNKLDSIWIFYNQLGDTIEKINYFLGKKNGYHYSYFKNRKFKNKIFSKELYLNGKKNDKSVFYYSNGSIKNVIPYENNKKQGIGYEYSIDKNIITIFRYRGNELIESESINRYNNESQKNGVWKEFYSNGILKDEKNYLNGKLDGYLKLYNDSGKLIEVLKYKNGEVDLQSNDFDSEIEIKEEYDISNNLIFRGSLKNNKKIGIQRYFNTKGKVIKSQTFNIRGNLVSEGVVLKTGKKEGDWIYYYSDHQKQSEGKYLRGNKNGKWIYYYQNGKIQQTGFYANGKFKGAWKWYYETGELLKEEFYIYGKPDGEAIEYTVFADIISKGNYIEGMKEGEWIYRIGDQKYKGKYVMDTKDGLWKSYYLQEESLSFEGKYLQGNPDGKHVYFYPDGSIMEERYYSEGEKVKSWSKYDENGKLIIVVQYKNGIEYKINGVKVNLNKEDN